MKYFSIILICVFTLLTTSFASQYGSISGYVLDESFEGLPGADIKILNTNYNGEADDNGYYKIIGVKAGICTVQLMFVGYTPFKVYNVKIVPDSDTEIVVCLRSDVMSDFYGEYDGSNAKITPYNPSQKNIDLEKTGEVDFKEKSKCPKLDFADKFNIFKMDKEGKLPIIDLKQLVGKYLIGSDGIVEFFIKDDHLFMRNYENPLSHLGTKLYHTGNNVFISLEKEGNIILNNNEITLNIVDKYDLISKGANGYKLINNNNIPILLLLDGKINEAIELYKNIKQNNPDDIYISKNRLKMLSYIFRSDKQYEITLALIKLNIDFNPDSADLYYDEGLTYEYLKDYKSSIQSYKKALKYNPKNKSDIESRIKEHAERIKLKF